MSFRLVPKSVTLNDLERRNGVILRCFSKFGYLPGALRKSSRSLSHLLMSSCLGLPGGCAYAFSRPIPEADGWICRRVQLARKALSLWRPAVSTPHTRPSRPPAVPTLSRIH